MARTLVGAIRQFLWYEISSRLRGDLVLEFETGVMQGPAKDALFSNLRATFPNAQYSAGGDEAGAWMVTVHIPHGGSPDIVRARLDEWAVLHRPPLTRHSVGRRSFRSAA